MKRTQHPGTPVGQMAPILLPESDDLVQVQPRVLRMASVMVVDDEDVLLEMIATLIEDIGHRPLVATNGQDALATLQAEIEPPLLIISDVMMPQMNGIALAKAIKADPRLRHVPIVLMSAAGKPPHEAPVDHFIPKPFDLERIERLIDEYLGGENSL